jgi:hypothetical protein
MTATEENTIDFEHQNQKSYESDRNKFIFIVLDLDNEISESITNPNIR